MTKDPVFCQASDAAVIAATLMKNIISALCLSLEIYAGKKLVGIITDRDLAMNVVAEAHDPNAITVDQAMSRPVVTCSPDDRYQKALDLMEHHQVKRIPAIDNSGQVVGMISEADVALRVRDKRRRRKWSAAFASRPESRKRAAFTEGVLKVGPLIAVLRNAEFLQHLA